MTTQNKQAHTAGPLSVRNNGETITIRDATGSHLAGLGFLTNQGRRDPNEVAANAARIVACVNAMEGLNPDAIADVVAAAKNVNDCFGVGYKNMGHLYIAIKPFMDELRTALKKLEAQS